MLRVMYMQSQGLTYETWAEANADAVNLIRRHGPEKAVEILVLGGLRASQAAAEVAEKVQAVERGDTAVTST